jgi:hypothetical protein
MGLRIVNSAINTRLYTPHITINMRPFTPTLDRDVLEMLNGQARMDVMAYINESILHKIPFFKDCDVGFVKSISEMLQSRWWCDCSLYVYTCSLFS